MIIDLGGKLIIKVVMIFGWDGKTRRWRWKVEGGGKFINSSAESNFERKFHLQVETSFLFDEMNYIN